MPNPNPVQSDDFRNKRLQRAVLEDSCIPEGTPLAEKTIGIRLPINVDLAIRSLGKQKAAWLREVICKAALEKELVDEIS
ncbi:MAG: hypothetical protein WA885_12590 [Phormidesmis sp.]